jgi:hypothetical protein
LPWTLWWDQPLKKLVCLFIHLWPPLRNEGFEHLWHYTAFPFMIWVFIICNSSLQFFS